MAQRRSTHWNKRTGASRHINNTSFAHPPRPACTPVVCLAGCFGVSLVILNALVFLVKMQDPLPLLNGSSGGSSSSSPLYHTLRSSVLSLTSRDNFPDAASYFEIAELQTKIEENIEFHQLGGSLKSVQKFMDSAIDFTLDKHGIQFLRHDGMPAKMGAYWYVKKYNEKFPPERGGYGQELPGKYSYENSPIFHERRWFDVIEPRRNHDKWDASLGPIGPQCKNLVQLGDRSGDGYKYYCRPDNNLRSGGMDADDSCHVISVGGNDNWKFEEAVVAQLGCITHTFDCTLPGGTPQRKPANDNIRFYNYCIDGHDHKDINGRNYLTYESMLQIASVHKRPSYFKIDVEGFEWDIFSNMIRSPEILPDQIQVELHWATRMTDLTWMQRTRSSAEIALLSGMMFNTGNYLPIKLDFNPHCTSCMEVLYFRVPVGNE